jgi:hypothetical protein
LRSCIMTPWPAEYAGGRSWTPVYHVRVPSSIGKVLLILSACWLTTGAIACVRASGGGSLFMVMPSETVVWFYALLAAGGFVIEAMVCLLLASVARAIRKGSEMVVYCVAIIVALGFTVVALS